MIKESKHFEVTSPMTQEDFLRQTRDCWTQSCGSKDGGIMHLKDGYGITGMDNVKVGEYAFEVGDKFYTNLTILNVDMVINCGDINIKEYCLTYPYNKTPQLDLSLHDFGFMLEVSQFDSLGFNIYILFTNKVLLVGEWDKIGSYVSTDGKLFRTTHLLLGL